MQNFTLPRTCPNTCTLHGMELAITMWYLQRILSGETFLKATIKSVSVKWKGKVYAATIVKLGKYN